MILFHYINKLFFVCFHFLFQDQNQDLVEEWYVPEHRDLVSRRILYESAEAVQAETESEYRDTRYIVNKSHISFNKAMQFITKCLTKQCNSLQNVDFD